MDLKYPYFMFFTGRPGQGKTDAIRYFVMLGCETGKFKYGCVISPTEESNGKYGEFLPDERIFTAWDPAIIQVMMGFQKKQGKNPMPAFLIVDDGLGTIPWGKDIWQELGTTWRQLNISLLIAAQWIHKIPQVLRECTSYQAMFDPGRSAASLQATYNLSASNHFENKQEWKNFLMKRRKKYSFIFHDNNNEDEQDPEKQFQVATIYHPLVLTKVKF